MKKIFSECLSLAEAISRYSARLNDLSINRNPAEIIDTSAACGRINASAVFARYSSPFFHSAAMDGYAVHSSETTGANETAPKRLSLGKQAVLVDTGDPMPETFDAVIMLEDVNFSEDGEIEIYAPVPPYKHVRPAGEDIVATELILSENHVIRPVDIGALLASGHNKISVVRRPVVAIIPTGTELIDASVASDRPPVPPEIIEYNSAMLAALAAEHGAEPLVFSIVADDKKLIKDAVMHAAEVADLVIINAGSGKGRDDYTSQIISEAGELTFNGVSIKPGKPVVAGIISNKPIIGIPGYPVSAYLTFKLFALPVIERLSGTSLAPVKKISAILSRQMASPVGIDEFVRMNIGLVRDRYVAVPASRGAGLLMSVVKADGILRVPAESDGVAAGSSIEIELLRPEAEICSKIVCTGSHDTVLDVLANQIRKRNPLTGMSSAHVGSMGGLMALLRGEAHVAGIHLLDPATGQYNEPYIVRMFHGNAITLVNMVYRQQGLIVRSGNPRGICGLRDLVRDDIIFINRQAGSGTRMLLDKSLKELSIRSELINGYERDEYTHMSVASAVATGLADTGLGIYSAARALGLDFIPITEERFDLAIPDEYMKTEKIQLLIDVIKHDRRFRECIDTMGGYDTRDSGKIMFSA